MTAIAAALLLMVASYTPTPIQAPLGPRITTSTFDGIVIPALRPDEWAPSRDDVLDFESRLVPYAESQFKRWNYAPVKKLSDYKRQYLGFYRGKQRILAVTFFFKDTDMVRSGKWLKVLTGVAGGGDNYLHALYDATAKRFEEFTINADR